MATPRGAEHRDLEQRLRDLEAQVRTLTSATLTRRQLSVTEGDFVVSGGGNVEVMDGGLIQARYASGQVVVHLGDWDTAAGLSVYAEDGDAVAFFGDSGTGPRSLVNDDGGFPVFASAPGGGLAAPNLSIPLFKRDVEYTTTNSSFQVAYWGDATHWAPQLKVRVLVSCPAGTTGQVRLSMSGTVVAGATSFTGAEYITLQGDVPTFVAGASRSIEVELRRLSGAGTVGVTPIQCIGVAS